MNANQRIKQLAAGAARRLGRRVQFDDLTHDEQFRLADLVDERDRAHRLGLDVPASVRTARAQIDARRLADPSDAPAKSANVPGGFTDADWEQVLSHSPAVSRALGDIAARLGIAVPTTAQFPNAARYTAVRGAIASLPAGRGRLYSDQLGDAFDEDGKTTAARNTLRRQREALAKRP
ncbi:MAG: hypothetical protein WB383_08320 [Acidimicrobiales bacterium]